MKEDNFKYYVEYYQSSFGEWGEKEFETRQKLIEFLNSGEIYENEVHVFYGKEIPVIDVEVVTRKDLDDK